MGETWPAIETYVQLQHKAGRWWGEADPAISGRNGDPKDSPPSSTTRKTPSIASPTSAGVRGLSQRLSWFPVNTNPLRIFLSLSEVLSSRYRCIRNHSRIYFSFRVTCGIIVITAGAPDFWSLLWGVLCQLELGSPLSNDPNWVRSRSSPLCSQIPAHLENKNIRQYIEKSRSKNFHRNTNTTGIACWRALSSQTSPSVSRWRVDV